MTKGNKNTNVGITSLIIGILGICLYLIEYSVPFFRLLFYASPFVAIITIILGYFGWKAGDNYGRIGIILGFIQLIISIVLFAYFYMFLPSQMIPRAT